ncbi:MAG: hypothetical protein Q9223_003299 [Gallowayella weberi]
MPVPEDDDARQTLFSIIDGLSTEFETYTKPCSAPVHGEWIGHRLNVAAQAPEPTMTEREKYYGLMRDASTQSRPISSKLATLTHGRCFSLKYRLAPQHPFPSAILDLLHAYLNLLYPSPDPSSYHLAVPANTLTLTGDSVGANLCLALLQMILSLSREQARSPPLIRWNGVDVALHVPQGIALISPWVDPTFSLPSCMLNRATDYLPHFSPCWMPGFPQCEAWPVDPPRGHLYCDASALVHPLVNAVAVEDWSGAPPMLLLSGEEVASDGAKAVAAQAHEQGVRVRWMQFERLPHVFMAMIRGLEHSELAMKEWAGFCEEVVKGREQVTVGGEFIRVRDLSRERVELGQLRTITREKALEIVRQGRDQRSVVRRKFEGSAKI